MPLARAIAFHLRRQVRIPNYRGARWVCPKEWRMDYPPEGGEQP